MRVVVVYKKSGTRTEAVGVYSSPAKATSAWPPDGPHDFAEFDLDDELPEGWREAVLAGLARGVEYSRPLIDRALQERRDSQQIEGLAPEDPEKGNTP